MTLDARTEVREKTRDKTITKTRRTARTASKKEKKKKKKNSTEIFRRSTQRDECILTMRFGASDELENGRTRRINLPLAVRSIFHVHL